MYTTVYEFPAVPDFQARYDAMLAEVGPENLLMHIAGPTQDGFVVVDTCPSPEVHQRFVTEIFPGLLARHGLPSPTRKTSFPAHASIADGRRIRLAVA